MYCNYKEGKEHYDKENNAKSQNDYIANFNIIYETHIDYFKDADMKEKFKNSWQPFFLGDIVSDVEGADRRWIKWMRWGKRIGCHQKPERSFFIRGYQFPVCARCTGVLIASLFACIAFAFYALDWKCCIIACAVMFLDWFIQRVGIRESTNIRRLVTGLIGGFGFMTLQLYAYRQIVLGVAGGINLLF